jgi:hypothetical protein
VISAQIGILWRLPAKIAERRLGIGNAEKLGDAETLDRSFFRFDNRAQFPFDGLFRPGGHSRP